MAKFNTAVITNKGKALITKAQAGLASIQFSKIATGNGSYTGSENLESAVELKTKKQEFPISSLSIINQNQVSLKSVISNTGLETGYYIKEIGLYAVDPDDGIILYSITTAVLNQWDYLPAYGSDNLATISLEISSTVSNTNTVSIVENQGVYALAEDLQQANIAIGLKLDKTGDSKDNVTTFTQAGTLANIATGEKHSVILGKIAKAIADLILLILNFNKAVLKSNVTLYVATTGNDTTGNGTSGAPYRTINKALSVIPKNLNGFSAIVNIANGTYAESVIVSDFHGGELTLQISAGGTVTVSRLIVKGSVIVNIASTTSTTAYLIMNSTTDIPFLVYKASLVKNAYVNITINGNSAYDGMVVTEFSQYQSATVNTITINNANSGVVVVNSKVYIYSLLGSGNVTGIYLYSGAIATVASNSISATTPIVKEVGSILLNDISTWVDISSTILKLENGAPLGISYALYNPATKEVRISMHCDASFIADGYAVLELPTMYRPTAELFIANSQSAKRGTVLTASDYVNGSTHITATGRIVPYFGVGVGLYYLKANFSYIVR